MSWLVHLLILAAALALLVKSADWLVEYGARVARRLGVSDLVIGLTLTSVGTSVPELASSVSAAIQDNPGLILGNVVGSNIANIGLILGVAALIKPFATDTRMHERDGFILFAATALVFVLSLDNLIDRPEALAFLGLYASYVGFVALSDRDKVEHQFRFFLNHLVRLDTVRPLVNGVVDKARHLRAPKAESSPDGEKPRASAADKRTLARELLAIAGAIVGVIIGARYLVQEATWAALQLGVPDALIGLSLVAVGTSLPELFVAVSAARRGNAGMIVGSVMGSNLANALLILGVSGSIAPLAVSEGSVVYTIPIMLFFTVGLLYVVKSGWRVSRAQGGLVLAAYAAFLALAFTADWS